jgi:heme/copper-type cytochrome/quinol oxidase subunit 3
VTTALVDELSPELPGAPEQARGGTSEASNGKVLPLHPRVLARERSKELTGAVGMIVALAGWTMMFASLMFVYFGLRSQALAWPPPGLPPMPLTLPSINTVVMLASSVTLAQALTRLRGGRFDEAKRWMGFAFALGLTFVVLQVVLWQGMWSSGITVATGTYGAVFYGLTVLHAIHVAAGLVVLGYLVAIAVRRSAAMRERVTTLRLCGMFWHFVDAVWLVMFVALFLY